MMRRYATLMAAFLGVSGTLLTGQQAAALPEPGTVTAAEWSGYQQRFVTPEGRIVDDANGNISHSEGQGYGLLLAYLAADRPSFERIWSFTRTELLLRDDGLAVWKWDPQTTPHVSDTNNASDGDLLIAYALALAADTWQSEDYSAAAQRIAEALGSTSVYRHAGETLLKPAVAGFAEQDRQDGPVVNLSYWVFEALPVMQRLAPAYDWQALGDSGRKIIGHTVSDEIRLPPDWLSLKRSAKPAEGFDPFFGYNALRIPLYLVRGDGNVDDLLRRMSGAIGDTTDGFPLMNVETGATTERLRDPGYRMISALLECKLGNDPIPQELTTFEPTNYYPSTLHLLALSYIRQEDLQCAR